MDGQLARLKDTSFLNNGSYIAGPCLAKGLEVLTIRIPEVGFLQKGSQFWDPN